MSRDQRKYKEADKQRRAGEREKRRLEKAMEDFKNGPIVLGDDAAARLREVLAETPTDGKEEE